MIVRRLLILGMVAGVLAGLAAALFARLAIEPSVDLAIAFEAARDAMPGMVHADEPELVSRAVQKGTGLLVAATCYGAALGGIFALVFAALHARVLHGGARVASAWLALAGFVTIALIPALKYPPNPPAVGFHETIQLRTAAFFGCIAVSLVLAAAAVRLAQRLRGRLGSFDAGLAAVVAYGAAMTIVALALPTIDEVPADFPATLLWTFRTGALATQAVLWAVLALVFGRAAERLLRDAR
ncbi:CbtA family protein [Sphingomonas ginsenosidivorax]|uniref:CbtA family protein n=1 Tax=Sphingomonas ginsenosidivorax TaxID=862135 RepID=UPI0018F735DD|nr:CbtA family protein [Sphingomonas ginsenosidivorax]